jgi:hypothetical protein
MIGPTAQDRYLGGRYWPREARNRKFSSIINMGVQFRQKVYKKEHFIVFRFKQKDYSKI